MTTATAAPPRPQPAPAEARRRRVGLPTTSDRLRLPHGLASGRFAVIVAALLTVGLISVLAINTSLAAGSLRLSNLESKLARAEEGKQALQVQVQGLSSPAALQAAASGLGMVPSAAPAFLDPSTGVVSGALTEAPAPAAPLVQSAQVKPPEPAPAATDDESTAGASAGDPVRTPQRATTADPDDRPTDPSVGTGGGLDAVVVGRPAPIPTAAPPADPGADGATIIRPGAGPVPQQVPSGDTATVLGGEAD